MLKQAYRHNNQQQPFVPLVRLERVFSLLFYLRLVFIVAPLKSLARKRSDLHIVVSVVLPSFNNTQSLGYG